MELQEQILKAFEKEKTYRQRQGQRNGQRGRVEPGDPVLQNRYQARAVQRTHDQRGG